MRLSLYLPGDSWVHRLDPITKILMALVTIALVFLLPGITGSAILLLVSLLILTTARVLRRLLSVFLGLTLIVLTFFVVQGLVYSGNATLVAQWGPIHFYREGLLVGLGLALRLYNIVAGTLLLVLTTRPSDLVESLVRRGFSPRFGYVIISVLQIIPNMASATSTITDAQRSRGMEVEGSLWTRVKAFIPLMGPLVTSSLIGTEERALALEVRGFSGGGKPTFLNIEQVPLYAFAVRILYLCAFLSAIVGRWFLS